MTRDEFDSLQPEDKVYVPDDVQDRWRNSSLLCYDWNTREMDRFIGTEQEVGSTQDNKIYIDGFYIPYDCIDFTGVEIIPLKKHRLGVR